MVLPLFGLTIFTFRLLENFTFSFSDILVLFLFFLLYLFSLLFFKHIKYISIKDHKLKFYSILYPFGKTLNISSFTGKIILNEYGTRGRYNVIYLIDKENITSFKIMGLHYKNFNEINNAIQLKEIKFSPSATQYFKLLFFEKIRLEKSGNKVN